nr:hypothetical protein [Phascolarctobacterium succinatutens]
MKKVDFTHVNDLGVQEHTILFFKNENGVRAFLNKKGMEFTSPNMASRFFFDKNNTIYMAEIF